MEESNELKPKPPHLQAYYQEQKSSTPAFGCGLGKILIFVPQGPHGALILSSAKLFRQCQKSDLIFS